jgi:hypothetical protein
VQEAEADLQVRRPSRPGLPTRACLPSRSLSAHPPTAQAKVKAEPEDKKPVKVKKEFDMPGQTRDTPPEVCCRVLALGRGWGAGDSPGQRRAHLLTLALPPHPHPSPRPPARPQTDAMRKFYTSLLEQKSDSEMARRW